MDDSWSEREREREREMGGGGDGVKLHTKEEAMKLTILH